MRWIALLLLAACNGASLEIVSDDVDDPAGWLHPGEHLRFRLHLRDRDVDCGAHWYANDVEGGSAIFGTIDDCGRYTAPAAFDPGLVEIVIQGLVVGEDETCFECGSSASIPLTPLPPTMP